MSNPTIALSQNMEKIAKDLDTAIEEAAGQRVAFALFVFTPNRASYISTAKRQEVITEIKKLLSYWEQGMPDIPAHEIPG